MLNDPSLTPLVSDNDDDSSTDSENSSASSHSLSPAQAWESLVRMGLGEVALRIATGLVSIILVLIVVWVMNNFYLSSKTEIEISGSAVRAAALPTLAPSLEPPEMVEVEFSGAFMDGIVRLAHMNTLLADKPRYDMTLYEVLKGDTIFGIAEKFRLKPETILWGNYETLADNPHSLKPGQKLNILPVDGVLYQWHVGDGLNGVASFYGVKGEDVVNFPANRLDPKNIGDPANPNIQPGTWLVIPGGKREFIAWSAPRITRKDTAVAKVLGPGACQSVNDGPIGTGHFIWPTVEKNLSGFDYSPATNHYGIDIAGKKGYAIFAADSGVVVYAGWNNWGYGYMIVIDHGNGWQSLYAHLDSYGVGCGAFVTQGNLIGTLGTTGNSSGPHLHFELRSDEFGRPNPWNFLAR